MTSYLSGMLVAFGAFSLAVVSPGPNMIAVIGASMGAGRRSGLSLALGISAGSLCWGVLSIAGLTSLMNTYASAVIYIKLLGALYLLWLAVKSFKSAMTASEFPAPLPGEKRRDTEYFWRGVIVQMTNPKAALTWLAILAVAVDVHTPYWVGTSLVLTVVVVSLLAYIGYALVFSSARVVALYRRLRRGIEASLGVFFCLASYKLFRSAI